MCICAHFGKFHFLAELLKAPDKAFVLHYHRAPLRLSLVNVDNWQDLFGVIFHNGVGAALCTEPRTVHTPVSYELTNVTDSQETRVCCQTRRQHCQHRIIRHLPLMHSLTITLTKYYNVVLWLQPVNYFCSGTIFDANMKSPACIPYLNLGWEFHCQTEWLIGQIWKTKSKKTRCYLSLHLSM